MKKAILVIVLIMFAVGVQGQGNWTYMSTDPNSIAISVGIVGQVADGENTLRFVFHPGDSSAVVYFQLYHMEADGVTPIACVVDTIDGTLRTYDIQWPALGQTDYFAMTSCNLRGCSALSGAVAITLDDKKTPAPPVIDSVEKLIGC